MIASGGTFSMNRALGKRTTSRGFVAAPMISGGRSVKFTARVARWSVRHRKTAIFGWRAFVLAAIVVGGAIGTQTAAIGEIRPTWRTSWAFAPSTAATNSPNWRSVASSNSSAAPRQVRLRLTISVKASASVERAPRRWGRNHRRGEKTNSRSDVPAAQGNRLGLCRRPWEAGIDSTPLVDTLRTAHRPRPAASDSTA